MAASASHFLVVVTLAFSLAAFVPASVMGAEITVGDDKGWTLNFDYQAWAQGKQFFLGDKLVFRYSEGTHNVLKVNGTDFQQCTKPASTQALSTGNDVIPLTTPGRHWYICGVANHCEVGKMKLVITVLPQVGSPSPAPSGSEVVPSAPAPSAAARGKDVPRCYALLAAVFGAVAVMIV